MRARAHGFLNRAAQVLGPARVNAAVQAQLEGLTFLVLGNLHQEFSS
jgi:hypothetical protein